jgi:glycosyltransferase involved in cell wall biosynthesis
MRLTPVMTRGSLLLIAPVLPADRGNGLAMRIDFFLRAYLARFDVDLAVFPVAGGPSLPPCQLLARVRRLRVFPPEAVDTHFMLVNALREPDARLAAFRRYRRPSLASIASSASRSALKGWIAGVRYDVVHVARLYLAPLADVWSGTPERPRLVLDCDEDDARAYRRLGAVERRAGCRQAADWAEAEAEAFARLAAEVLPRFDDVLAASPVDARMLRADGARGSVVPNVAPLDATPLVRRPIIGLRPGAPAARTILFVGTMGYAPNADGVRWLLTRVWPRLRAALACRVRLVIVGSGLSATLVRLARRGGGVHLAGAVPDVCPFYRAADVAVIPLRAGAGTRIKLMEAAAHGVPVVSTSLGIEGTTFRHGRELLLADSAETFAGACAYLLRRPAEARRMAARARLRLGQDYDRTRWSVRVADRAASGICSMPEGVGA